MEFALVDGRRRAAFKSGRGTCAFCEAAMIAKCGPRMPNHWAHAVRQSCDPWWENETPWHRTWKSAFPEHCRERLHVAPDGELHRADVVTTTGIVVEIQNSPISDAERQSREAFYGNMIWIVNGTPFRAQFDIYHQLPDPDTDLGGDIVWYKAHRALPGTQIGMFWRKSENPDAYTSSLGLVEVHDTRKLSPAVRDSFCGHHQYDWVRPRAGWLESACPVFIDFGEEWVWQLGHYGAQKLPCVRAVSKVKLVHDAMTEVHAAAIATRFYPLTGSSYVDGALALFAADE
jgi:competence protein CoiA